MMADETRSSVGYETTMFIKSVRPRGFLSFPSDTPSLELQPLNVLIGPNGAGKSNLLESVRFLRASATARGAVQHFLLREGAGIGDWIWKGEEDGTGSVEIVFGDNAKRRPLRYRLAFREERGRAIIVEERLEEETATRKGKKPDFYIGYDSGGLYLNRGAQKRRALSKSQIDPEASVLSVYNGAADYPENAWMFEAMKGLQFYCDPLFGRGSQLRVAQSTGLNRSALEENGSNLALVLNRVLQKSKMRDLFTTMVREVYPHVDFVDTDTSDNRIQVVFVEKKWKTPANRLSDGTMRWVFLLTLLLDPENRSPIFLDEPDLGLHPDALRALADLLKEASKRTQIIVTTHNVTLIDHFTETPEVVVVFDNVAPDVDPDVHSTGFLRLTPDAVPTGMLLGETWQRGLIGGNRW